MFKKLYNSGVLYSVPSMSYEFGNDYAYILISENSNNPEIVFDSIKKQITEFKEKGLVKEDFDRIKKMIYGDYIREFNDVAEIARLFLSDFMKGINSFDYLEEINQVDILLTQEVLNDNFKEDKMVLSVVSK